MDVREIIKNIQYKPNSGFTAHIKGECVFIQHWQVLRCTKTSKLCMHKGRKFYISPYMTNEEIIRTLRLAVVTFEEHEVNENLRYKGERVLNPHPEGPRPNNE